LDGGNRKRKRWIVLCGNSLWKMQWTCHKTDNSMNQGMNLIFRTGVTEIESLPSNFCRKLHSRYQLRLYLGMEIHPLCKKLRMSEHETMDKHRKLSNPNSLDVTEGLLSTANVSDIRPILERHGEAKVPLCQANVCAPKGNNKRWWSTVDLS
jgi:hypothetical protein